MSGIRRLLLRAAVPAVALLAPCGVFAVNASAADAAPWPSGSCLDNTIASGTAYTSPGPGPGFSNRAIGDFRAGLQAELNCTYIDNVKQGRWYAEIVPNNTYTQLNWASYGYIWVQRLFYGSAHECTDFFYNKPIGSSECPLIQVDN